MAAPVPSQPRGLHPMSLLSATPNAASPSVVILPRHQTGPCAGTQSTGRPTGLPAVPRAGPLPTESRRDWAPVTATTEVCRTTTLLPPHTTLGLQLSLGSLSVHQSRSSEQRNQTAPRLCTSGGRTPNSICCHQPSSAHAEGSEPVWNWPCTQAEDPACLPLYSSQNDRLLCSCMAGTTRPCKSKTSQRPCSFAALQRDGKQRDLHDLPEGAGLNQRAEQPSPIPNLCDTELQLLRIFAPFHTGGTKSSLLLDRQPGEGPQQGRCRTAAL